MNGPVKRGVPLADEEIFEADGALRDVCVLSAEAGDWDRVISALREPEAAEPQWEVEFSTTHPLGDALLHSGAAALFAALERSGDSASLSVRIDGIWFTSYFFDWSEIEFTFDPVDVVGPPEVEVVEDFMRRVGDACGRRVVMTMETSTHHEGLPALFEYTPGRR
ncbi:hypothetical protein [Streptomyces sp. AC550_RSS872]|uniref:hypothetical protein n=1 Tax=Streptomyces sp. AC550_RSS872 TaxID=2823689 RepID=UPI001C25A754|nr:hypothetical protein [Streptomyces sp. AC550_RSS872]